MIADLKPYPAVKDSGVEWLGKVPEHWEVQRLRNMAEMRVSNVDKHSKEDETSVRLCNYVDVYKNDRISEQMDFMRATATSEEIERFRLVTNDVLITKDSETWDDIGVPALVTEPANDLISGYHLALLRPFTDLLCGGYLLRALQSKAIAYQFHVEAKGVTRYGLSHAGIKSVWFPLPPFPEQTAIVRFIDYVDLRIRRYIRAKQKLIRLLEEQKQAIIHRAVTRGLDPDVALKDSGVQWLGEVPEHWEVRQLRRLVASGKRITYGIVQPGEPDASGRFMVRGQDYSFGWVTPGRVFRVSDAIEAPYQRSRLAAGDLVLTIVGAGVGNVAIVPEWLDGANITQTTSRVSPDREKVLGKFLRCVLDGPVGRRNIELYVKGAAQPGLNLEHVRVFLVPIPPIDEQQAIVSYVQSKTSPLDESRLRAEREIELLNEYRSRLIADVVTGKLDVREAAVALPDEPLGKKEMVEDVEVRGETDLNTVSEEAET